MKAFKLENEPKITTGFKTPEHYFDDLSAKVLQQINEKQTEVKVIPIYKRKNVIAMLVAALVVVALMIPIANNYMTKSKELDEATLETYLAYQSNINQYDLIRELDTTDIKKLDKNIALDDEADLEDILASNPNIEHLISE